MTSIKNFLRIHSISAQSVSGAWVFVVVVWATQPAFKDYVFAVYNDLPKGVHQFIAGVVIPALILWRSQRKGIAIAEAAPGEQGIAKASASTGPVE